MIYGTGIDIVEVKRVESIIKCWEDKFLNRIFTENEIKYCQKKSNPFPHFAARFATKEAVAKMFGTGLGKINWKDIEVINKEKGKPYLHFSGGAKKEAVKNNIKNVHLSLSHEKEYAIAQVVAEGGK
ncbi:MAG: holo-ACP synthase [Bacillota bacterium]